jgi:hypothetical protein
LSRISVREWAAWAPGIETEKEWRQFALEPRALGTEGAPALRFVPSLLRRRCDQLSRMMMQVAEAACDVELRGEVACIFASRYGSLSTTVSLLETLAADEPISPTRFSHSVHNTQAGLFSIWARNPQPSMSVAAGVDTFAHGFLEAVCALNRVKGSPVLFVAGDEPVPEPFASIVDYGRSAFAIALLIAEPEPGMALDFRLEAARENDVESEQPHELAFLRWWLSEEKTLRIVSGTRVWVWAREA